MGLAALLAPTVGAWFAEQSVATFRVGEPGTWWTGPVPMVFALTGAFTYGLPFATWLIFAAAPLFGATPGQSLLGLTTVAVEGESPGRGARWRRFLMKAAPWSLGTAGLVIGQWVVAAGGVAALLPAAIGAIQALARGDGRTWWDRWSGTRIRRAAVSPARGGA